MPSLDLARFPVGLFRSITPGPAVYQFDSVVKTVNKMIQIAKASEMRCGRETPSHCAFGTGCRRPSDCYGTELQGCVRSIHGFISGDELIRLSTALGNTVPEVDLQSLGPLHLGTVEKSLFSMVTPEVITLMQQHDFKSVIVMGIEVGQLSAIFDLCI